MINTKKILGYSSVLIFYFTFWFFLFTVSYSLTSGYSMIDDNVMYDINDALQKNNIFAVFWHYLSNDVGRFRPFYWVNIFTQAGLFGTNHLYWSIYAALLGVFTSFFLYIFAKKIDFSNFEAFIFSFLSVVGLQSVVWWEIMLNENIAMLMLSIGLIFMALSVKSKGSKIYEILFILFTVLSALSKESFLLLMPALLLWKNWLYKNNNDLTWKDTFKNNIVWNLILSFTFFLSLIIIKFFIGTSSTGYVGISDFLPDSYMRTFLGLSLRFGYVNISIFAIFLILLNYNFKNLFNTLINFVKSSYIVFILFILIVFPQIILFTRSGFYDRYLFPIILGYVMLIAYLLKFMRQNSVNYFKRLSIFALLIFTLLIATLETYEHNFSYAWQGRLIKQTLNYIANNTDESSTILIAGRPIEDTVFGIKNLLIKQKNRKNLYVFFFWSDNFGIASRQFVSNLINDKVTKEAYEKSSYGRETIKDLTKMFEGKILSNIKDKNTIKIILVNPNFEKDFLNSSKGWFKIKSYKRVKFSWLVIYSRE